MELKKANRQDACRNDVWRPVPGYEGLYEIHWRGIIRNAETLWILMPGIGGPGYLTVALYKDKIGKTFTVHRLNQKVWGVGVEKEMVNHKDGIKTNPHISNLEYATRSENEIHGHKMGLKKPVRPPRGVIQYDLNGNEVARHHSSEIPGFGSGNICRACNKGLKYTHKGFRWAFIN